MPNKAIKKEELIASHKLLSDKFKKQAETFRSDEAWLRTLIDRLPFDIFLIGRDDRYLLQNTSCKNNWGDIIGKRPEDACKDKKTLAIWKSNNSRAFGGETVEEEVSFKVKGEKKSYFNIISPVREKKEITGTLGINIDITKLKQTERALKAEKEFTETALDTQKDTFFVFDPKTRQAIRWNKAFNKVSGYSEDEIRSMKAPDSYYSKNDLKKAVAAIENLSKRDTVVVEMSLINKKGKTIPTEYIGSALRDEKGRLKYIIAIGQDISRRRQAEEALRQLNSELEQKVAERTAETRRFHLAFQNAKDAIFWVDPDTGVLLECNKAAERLLEKGRDEILGKHLTTLYPAEDKERYSAMFQEQISREDSRSNEAVIVTRSGKRIPVFISSSMISVGDTSVIQGIFTDITERKETQKRLEESERKYRELVEDINDTIYSIDTKGNVVYISPAIKSLIGYEPHEMIGKHFLNFVHSDDLQTMKKGFESSLEDKATPADYRIINKAGSYVWIRALSKTIKDDKNNVIGIRGAVSDITERKRMEEALRLNENQLIKAQRIAGLGFLTWNLKTNKIVWSDEVYELYGCEKDKYKVTIESTVGLVHPDDLEYVQKNLDAAVKGIDKYDIDHRMVRPDGRVIWVHANAELVRDKDGKPELLLGTVLDITHRKAIQGQLDSLRRELLHTTRRSTMGELTAALAHELNQPLAAILTNAQAAQRFLKKEKTDLDIVCDILTDIVSDDKRAKEIILKLRSLMSTRTVEFNELDINELVDGIVPLIRADAIIKNVKLTVDLKKGLPPVLGDQIELQQVVLNIILNGFESMEDKDKKELTIFTKQDDAETITVGFRDSGFGIKEEDIENFFRPFITTKKKGMGMGLTISRSIIEAHSGKIWAKNNPDEGATFYFTLPVKSKVQNNAKS